MTKFTFERNEKTKAVDWSAEFVRFRTARLVDTRLTMEAADLLDVDLEILRRANDLRFKSEKDIGLPLAIERMLERAKLDGTEEHELFAMRHRALTELTFTKRNPALLK